MNDKKTLKQLIERISLFFLPMILLVGVSVILDPFKVYREHEEYNETVVALNREFVCLKLYQRNVDSLGYDSFLFGNSRSQAFKVKNWQAHLPPNSRGFHFDGAGGGIYGIYNRIRYIDESGGRLANALIIVDEYSLTSTKDTKGFLFVSPPQLSNASSFSFYSEFIKPMLNLSFVIGYLDYSIFGVHRSYMSNLICKPNYRDVHDLKTGDVYYGADRVIWEDTEGYYREQVEKGVFYDRRERKVVSKPVTGEEKELLLKIKGYFDKHGTDYRIVICPHYDQKPLSNDQLQLLNHTFGAQTVFDYSGRNQITESIYNYYEDSHFRPNVGDAIMQEVYYRNRPSQTRYLSQAP